MERKYFELFSRLGENGLMDMHSDICNSLDIEHNTSQSYNLGMVMLKSFAKGFEYGSDKN